MRLPILLILLILALPIALGVNIDATNFQPIYGNNTAVFNRIYQGDATHHGVIALYNTTNGIMFSVTGNGDNCFYEDPPAATGIIGFSVNPPANNSGFNITFDFSQTADAMGFGPYFSNKSATISAGWFGGLEPQFTRFRLYDFLNGARIGYSPVTEGSNYKVGTFYLDVQTNGTAWIPRLYYNGTRVYAGAWTSGNMNLSGAGTITDSMDIGLDLWWDNGACPTASNITITGLTIQWYGGTYNPTGPLNNYSVSWFANSTNVTAYNYTVVGGFSINWTSGNATGKNVSYSIFSSNNTGDWVNATEQAVNAYSAIVTDALTLNQSEANFTLGYKWFGNSSDGLWNVTDIFIVTKTNYTTPLINYTPNWFSLLNNLTGTYRYAQPLQFWANWTMPNRSANSNLSYYIFSHNSSGIWVNETEIAFTPNTQSQNVSFNLTTGHYLVIGYKWYANTTDDGWNVTDESDITGYWAPQFYFYFQNATNIKKGSQIYVYTNVTDQYNLSCQMKSLRTPAGVWMNNTFTCIGNWTVCATNFTDCRTVPYTNTFSSPGQWVWKWYVNNSNNIFNISDLQYLIVNETYAPAYSNNGSNASVVRNNSIVRLYQYWTMPNLSDTPEISYIIFSTNNTGSWVNDTPVAVSNQSINFTKDLTFYNPSYSPRTVGYTWFANSTDSLWNTTPEYILTYTGESWVFITNCSDLQNIQTYINNGSDVGREFGLTQDIDCANVPFTTLKIFHGSLLGNNHTISNLNITGGTENNVALFGKVSSNVTITNLILVNATVRCLYSGWCGGSGILIGSTTDATGSIYVNQVGIKNSIVNIGSGASNSVGGFLGYKDDYVSMVINNSYMQNSYVSTSASGAGSIVGSYRYGTFSIKNTYCGQIPYDFQQVTAFGSPGGISGWTNALDLVPTMTNVFSTCNVPYYGGNIIGQWAYDNDTGTYYDSYLSNGSSSGATGIDSRVQVGYWSNATKYKNPPMTLWDTNVWRLNQGAEYPEFVWEAYNPLSAPVNTYLAMDGDTSLYLVSIAWADHSLDARFTNDVNMTNYLVSVTYPNSTVINSSWTDFTNCTTSCNLTVDYTALHDLGLNRFRVYANDTNSHVGASSIFILNITDSGIQITMDINSTTGYIDEFSPLLTTGTFRTTGFNISAVWLNEVFPNSTSVNYTPTTSFSNCSGVWGTNYTCFVESVGIVTPPGWHYVRWYANDSEGTETTTAFARGFFVNSPWYQWGNTTYMGSDKFLAWVGRGVWTNGINYTTKLVSLTPNVNSTYWTSITQPAMPYDLDRTGQNMYYIIINNDTLDVYRNKTLNVPVVHHVITTPYRGEQSLYQSGRSKMVIIPNYTSQVDGLVYRTGIIWIQTYNSSNASYPGILLNEFVWNNQTNYEVSQVLINSELGDMYHNGSNFALACGDIGKCVIVYGIDYERVLGPQIISAAAGGLYGVVFDYKAMTFGQPFTIDNRSGATMCLSPYGNPVTDNWDNDTVNNTGEIFVPYVMVNGTTNPAVPTIAILNVYGDNISSIRLLNYTDNVPTPMNTGGNMLYCGGGYGSNKSYADLGSWISNALVFNFDNTKAGDEIVVAVKQDGHGALSIHEPDFSFLEYYNYGNDSEVFHPHYDGLPDKSYYGLMTNLMRTTVMANDYNSVCMMAYDGKEGYNLLGYHYTANYSILLPCIWKYNGTTKEEMAGQNNDISANASTAMPFKLDNFREHYYDMTYAAQFKTAIVGGIDRSEFLNTYGTWVLDGSSPDKLFLDFPNPYSNSVTAIPVWDRISYDILMTGGGRLNASGAPMNPMLQFMYYLDDGLEIAQINLSSWTINPCLYNPEHTTWRNGTNASITVVANIVNPAYFQTEYRSRAVFYYGNATEFYTPWTDNYSYGVPISYSVDTLNYTTTNATFVIFVSDGYSEANTTQWFNVSDSSGYTFTDYCVSGGFVAPPSSTTPVTPLIDLESLSNLAGLGGVYKPIFWLVLLLAIMITCLVVVPGAFAKIGVAFAAGIVWIFIGYAVHFLSGALFVIVGLVFAVILGIIAKMSMDRGGK